VGVGEGVGMTHHPPEFVWPSERERPTHRIWKHPPPRNCYHSSACMRAPESIDCYEVQCMEMEMEMAW